MRLLKKSTEHKHFSISNSVYNYLLTEKKVTRSDCCIFPQLFVLPRFASTPERRNENINVNKYLISSSGGRTHNQSILQSHFVPLLHDWSLILICFLFFYLSFVLLTFYADTFQER